MKLFAKIFLSVFCFTVIVIFSLSFILIRNQVIYVGQQLISQKKNIGDFLSKQIGVGYIQSQLPYESLNKLTKSDDFLFWWIVKDDGMIYRSDKTSFMGTMAYEYFPEVAKIPSDQSVFVDKAGNYGIFLSNLNVSDPDWKFWYGFSTKGIDELEKNILFYSISVFVFSVIILGILLYFIVLFFLKPIKFLSEGVGEVSKGNLNYVTKVKSKDEIGDLAKGFNKMVDSLLEFRRRIEAKVRDLSAEQGRLSSLVESIKLGVVMVDLNLNIILTNATAKEIFGRSMSKNLTFKDLSKKIKGGVNISQALSYYVHTGKPLNIQEVMIGESYYRLFMSPVRDIIEHIFIGAVVVMEDITEHKKIDQMRTEIVSITSHQLRTPATIVKGNLEMVLGGDVGKITKAQKDLLDDTYTGNERMIHLINDLMDAAKINEGKMTYPLAFLGLDEVAEEVVKENRNFAKEKRVVLNFFRPSEPLPKVKINREKIKQVFQNLIDNAVRYSAVGDKGNVVVNVKKDKMNVCVEVKDNGIGIPKNEQDKIFERFSRGSNSTKLDPGGGSGLGLYIAKAVVEQGGGKIWFDSKEGEGTTFYVAFPIN